MPRRPFVALSALFTGATVLAAPQTPTYRADTHTVSVYTTVVDDTGRLVPDLSRDDFEVYDNGARQPLTVFDNGLQPITIVVMLDRSQSMLQNFDLVRDAAEAFVGDLLPQDRTRIGSFSSDIRIDPQTFTSDKHELIRILREDLQKPGPTPLWNATAQAMNALAHEDGRRVVLTFTDGKDTPGWMVENVPFEEVRRRSQAEEIMIYGIGLSERCGPLSPDPGAPPPAAHFQRGPGGGRIPIGGGGGGRGPRIPIPGTGPRIPTAPFPGPPIGDGGIRRPGDRWMPPPTPRDLNPCADSGPDPDLRELAAEGGGGYFELHGTDNLGETFARVADELHHQYLLAFAAPSLDGEVHQLSVRVTKPGLTVRARKSYLAARNE